MVKMMRSLKAKFVLPISSEPIRDGAVIFEEGRIVAVGPATELEKQYPGIETEDLGDAAILPGFVNCHSHLEITGMRGALDSVEHDFRSWLLKLNAIRSDMTDEQIESAALDGAREGIAAGVTCVGDIGRYGKAGLRAMKETGLRGIIFQETEFSPDNRTADEDFLKLSAKAEELLAESTDLVRIGISPHSPYTVSSRLFELIAQYAIINRLPLSIHAAESANEIELLEKGTGFFTEVYEKFDVEWQSPFCSPIEYLERLGVLSARPLLAHCVRVTDDDIKRIAANGAKIAHCPRSNAKFGHGWAPFERFLDAGIAVGLGSDSVASNNVCDILAEASFAAFAARNRPDRKRFITARDVLRAATLGGAEALGLEDKIGTLEAGKQADLVVVALDDPAQQPVTDVEAALVFSSNAKDVLKTLVGGNEIYSIV